jgi:hypothetical protein
MYELSTNRPQFSKEATSPLVRVGHYAARWPIYWAADFSGITSTGHLEVTIAG